MSSNPRILVVGAGPSSQALIAQLRRSGVAEVTEVVSLDSSVELASPFPTLPQLSRTRWPEPLWYQRYARTPYGNQRSSRMR